jgi:putative endonuclease
MFTESYGWQAKRAHATATTVDSSASQATDQLDFASFSNGKRLAQSAGYAEAVRVRASERRGSPRYYTGLTSDVAKRQATHSAGLCRHTAKHCPWSFDVIIEFADERRAVALERYLKSGSGVAFAKRHLR